MFSATVFRTCWPFPMLLYLQKSPPGGWVWTEALKCCISSFKLRTKNLPPFLLRATPLSLFLYVRVSGADQGLFIHFYDNCISLPFKVFFKRKRRGNKEKEEGISWQASGYNSGLSLPRVQVGSLVRELSVYIYIHLYIYIYIYICIITIVCFIVYYRIAGYFLLRCQYYKEHCSDSPCI